MPYQYKREPLSDDEANQLQAACDSFEEKLVVWTLIDTGLRVQELCGLAKTSVLWQEQRLVVFGKGRPYGKQSKRRVLPLTPAGLPTPLAHLRSSECHAARCAHG